MNTKGQFFKAPIVISLEKDELQNSYRMVLSCNLFIDDKFNCIKGISVPVHEPNFIIFDNTEFHVDCYTATPYKLVKPQATEIAKDVFDFLKSGEQCTEFLYPPKSE